MVYPLPLYVTRGAGVGDGVGEGVGVGVGVGVGGGVGVELVPLGPLPVWHATSSNASTMLHIPAMSG